MQERIIHTEDHLDGGVDYTINVIKEGPKLYGAWVCSCGIKHGSSVSDPNVQTAVESAKLNFLQHFRFEHMKTK